MAKKLSVLKRQRQDKKRKASNKTIKSRVKGSVKDVKKAIVENKPDYQKMLKDAMKGIDKATSKGVFHKNTASRKKSRLQKFVNKLAAEVKKPEQ